MPPPLQRGHKKSEKLTYWAKRQSQKEYYRKTIGNDESITFIQWWCQQRTVEKTRKHRVAKLYKYKKNMTYQNTLLKYVNNN